MTGRYLGWDMPTALSLGTALGIPPALIGELLPDIERAAMNALNTRNEGEG